MKKVAVSGGFDPIHYGHLQMFEEAKKLGDYLIVIINGDGWLMRKKGFVFMPALQRAAIIGAFSCVDEVYIHDSEDDDVCQALNKLNVDIFANGGDRKSDNTPEVKFCDEKGIQMAFNVGGGKVESSSEMVARARKKDVRPWGEMTMLKQTPEEWVKEISINPGHRNSFQSHAHRDEQWLVLEGTLIVTLDDVGFVTGYGAGDTVYIAKGRKHRFAAPEGYERPTRLLEISTGAPSEDDIIRYEDDYKRS